MVDHRLHDLLAAAAVAPFRGWDFSWLGDRYSIEPTPWDYAAIVAAGSQQAASLLDMGTGGGEFLSTVDPLPSRTVATEAYPPNWSVAAGRLAPLGVPVVAVEPCPDNNQWDGKGGSLPFQANTFDLVVNRHEAYSPIEVARILTPGGVFITQQVGSGDEAELLDWFDRSPPAEPDWNLDYAITQLETAGLDVIEGAEAYPAASFADVGAVAYYLSAAPWQVPDFDIADDYPHLARLHTTIKTTGRPLRVTAHRFWLTASRSATP